MSAHAPRTSPRILYWWPKFLFFVLFIYPLVRVVLGLRLRHPEHLPEVGPAILVANHNSHLDTAVLMSLYPFKSLHRLRAVAAADYFLSTKWLAWISTRMVGIIPIARKKAELVAQADPLEGVCNALAEGSIVLFFPEGSRGLPEKMTDFKLGIAKVADRFPDVPIVPIFLHGLGKALPRGEGLLVPFFCDAVVGKPTRKLPGESGPAFVTRLRKEIATLGREIHTWIWE